MPALHKSTISIHSCIKFFCFREREIDFEKKQATRRYVDEFKKKREEWKQQERQRLEQENERIKEYASMQQAREEERMESKRQEEEAKAVVQDRVCLFKYFIIKY